ncbi:MAG: right-handed parallel beta-helix repeat-containing protein, partial [Nanoarchaeota archaeon]|nr:right-handed parallel beta-helix repeat-containing protein [Nanoarchaeota archaeon]
MKKILFVMLFAIMLLSVNGYADFYQCYYQNATANGVNITDEVGLLYSGIVINLGENLRCNDTVIYVTDFFDGVGEIINYGNLTFENFTIGFDLTVAGGGYINSTGNLTINNSVIFSYKSSGGNDFWIGDIASATTIINNSYIQYAGWANVDYQRGVEFFSAFDSIKNTTIDSGYYGIVIHEDGLTIDNCTFNFSTRDGIHALSNNNTLTNNLFYTNAYYDIYTNAESNLIENNSMLPTTESRVGVYLDTGSNWNIINNNTFTDDTISGIGIRIFGVDHNTVSNNTFYNISNSGSGIRMDGANYNTIVENEFFASLDFGIRIVTSSTFNTISNNTFDSLDTYAIQVEDSSVNNTIQYNDIDSIPGTGIQIYNSQSTIIQFNSVDWCGIGIDIADTGGSSNHSIIYNNTGSFNTLNGIAVENSAATSPQGKINVSYNTIRYTTNPGSSAGIWIHVSYDGYVDYNVAENNAYNNIRLHDPGYQTVRYNNVSGGPHGFWHDWTHYSNYIGNRVWNTTIDGFHSTNDLIGEYSTVYNHSFNLTDVNFKFNNIILGEVYDINVPANTSGLLKLDYSYIILNESVGPGLTVGWIYLNLTYNESKVFNESNLGIYLYNTTYSTDWIYLSSEINQVDNYAYSGNLSLFGVVAVFEEETPMTITIQYPQNTTYNSPFWANITTSEEASWCGLSMNSTINQTMTNATGNQYQNISGIASGNHNIQFVCNDTYGRNYSTGTINFTIDTTPPVRSAGSPSGTIYTASTTVSLTTNEAAVCRYATSS